MAPNRDADMVGVAIPEPIWKTGGLWTKNQDFLAGERKGKERRSLPGAGQENWAGGGQGLGKCLPVRPDLDVHIRPVVETSPLEVPVLQAEAQGLYKVQRSLGSGAETGNGSSVWGDFRLKKNNVHENGSISELFL